jgi:hypothetical protein
MTVEEFHQKRKPFYIDSDTLIIKFPTSKYINESHAKWFSEVGYPYLPTVRGYLSEDESYVMLYWNDFEIPNINITVCCYLFDYFTKIKWIGVGCNKGKPGEIWTPKLKVYRGDESL